MKKTLLFDFDGTIGDSFVVLQEIFYELTGHPRITDPNEIESLRHLPFVGVAKKLGVTPWQIPRLVVQGRKAMNRHMPEVQPFPGMVEALKALHDDGYRMYILSSNSSQNVKFFLEAHGLSDFFLRVYGGVGLVGKAGAIRKVMRQNKLLVQDCLYIGDETRDIEGAKKAGVSVLAVGWGINASELLAQLQPDGLAQTPQEMKMIIQSM